MDSKKIEQAGVAAVINSILPCKTLSSFVSDNDREPSWDGQLNIYKKGDHAKSNFIGRVPVQVKGTIQNNLSKAEIAFPVEVSDLNNYLSDGGAIYFVVYISETMQDSKIYYSTLTPVVLRGILRNCKSQTTKSIRLKEFPLDPNRKTSIVRNFYEDSKRQASFSHSKLPTLRDLENSDSKFEWTMSVVAYGYENKDFHQAFFENEIYLYAKMGNVSIPLEDGLVVVATSEEVLMNVAVDGRIYYTSYKLKRSNNKIDVFIGDSFHIMCNLNEGVITSYEIECELSSSLKNRTADLEFILALSESNKLCLGERTLTVSPKESVNFEEEGRRLEYYKKILNLLTVLHVDEDLKIDILSKKDYNLIDLLIKAICDKEEVRISGEELSEVLHIRIGNLKLLLVAECIDRSKNTYRFYDFFGKNLIFLYADEKRKQLKTSCYSYLQKNGYLQVDNIDFDAICPSYQELISENDRIFERANNDMLMMLLAYDEGAKKSVKLLDTACKIANWLLNESSHSIPHEACLINYYQIMRRMRTMNKDEVNKLIQITEDHNVSEEIKVGAYLLLDNQSAAMMHFDKMDKKRQKLIKACPISKFWRN